MLCPAWLSPRVTRQNQIHPWTHHVFIFNSFFFSPHSQIFSGVQKEASAGVNTFEEVRNFREKKSKFANTHALFSLSCVHPRLSLIPRGLRAHRKSVESRTRTVSSRVTLARESRRIHSTRVYSRHKTHLLPILRPKCDSSLTNM